MSNNPSTYFAAPKLPATGLEADLSEFEQNVQASVRRYAATVLRPIGIELDRKQAEEVIAIDSPLWRVFAEFQKLGLSLEALAELPGLERGRLFALVFEELGWGDGGLAIALGAAMVPTIVLDLFGRADLLSRYADKPIGCWGITEPDHGSDMLDAAHHAGYPGARYGRGNCRVRREGDELVITGQKAAWISNGTIAQTCMLFCSYEDDQDEQARCVVMVPLDLPGVSRGKPLDKLGQRALPQGEIFFDQVRVPLDHLIAAPEDYARAEYGILSEANAMMSAIWTGAARAAYELALDYTQQRRQGGARLCEHQNVRYRLLHMFRRLEASRALSRRVMSYTLAAPIPALQGSIAAKITATQTAFELASEALQLHGGNGLTREYPIEKILRDTRSALIEDGCNELLAIKGGALLVAEC